MWASLKAQLVKNPPARQETPVRFARSGRSTGEGIGYPLQDSWASLLAQLVKTACNARDLGLIPGLGRSNGEGKAAHSSVLAWRTPWTVWSRGSQIVRHD